MCTANATPEASARLVAEDVAYAEGSRHTLDVYVPAGAPTTTPVVVFFYGGGWQFGKKSMLRRVAEVLAGEGFVVVAPDYRVYPEVTFPGFVEDAASAIAWTHGNIARYGGDPDRIVLSGHSAGAHIAALVALDRHYLDDVGVPHAAIRGVVTLSGPYYHPPSYRDQRWHEIFDSAGDLNRTEPMRYVSDDGPSLLLLVGGADTAVPPLPPMIEAARAAGERVNFKIYPGLDHGGTWRAIGDPSIAPVLADITAFIRSVTVADR